MSTRLMAACIALLAIGGAAAAQAQDYSAYSGAELYRRFCASCHGVDGRGDGPVAPLLATRPADLTRIAAVRDGKFPEQTIRRIVDGRQVMPPHGSRDMPVWGFEFRVIEAEHRDAQRRVDQLIDRLVEHVRSLQRAEAR